MLRKACNFLLENSFDLNDEKDILLFEEYLLCVMQLSVVSKNESIYDVIVCSLEKFGSKLKFEVLNEGENTFPNILFLITSIITNCLDKFDINALCIDQLVTIIVEYITQIQDIPEPIYITFLQKWMQIKGKIDLKLVSTLIDLFVEHAITKSDISNHFFDFGIHMYLYIINLNDEDKNDSLEDIDFTFIINNMLSMLLKKDPKLISDELLNSIILLTCEAIKKGKLVLCNSIIQQLFNTIECNIQKYNNHIHELVELLFAQIEEDECILEFVRRIIEIIIAKKHFKVLRIVILYIAYHEDHICDIFKAPDDLIDIIPPLIDSFNLESDKSVIVKCTYAIIKCLIDEELVDEDILILFKEYFDEVEFEESPELEFIEE